MRHALRLARAAAQHGEVPIGAVIVRDADGIILGEGRNMCEERQLATRHAEMIAIEQAAEKVGSWRLNSEGPVSMYVNVEPCLHCYGAMLLSRIETLHFGARNHRFGFLSAHEIDTALGPRRIGVKEGELANDSVRLLQDFFSKRRQ